jgi:prepilin-type N-terminal cleavage/methylation domain-containing protein
MCGQPKDAGCEAGFTLIELLISVVIVGIIMSSVLAVIVMTLQLGPDVSDRNRYASESSFFINTMSDDVANAASAQTVSFGANATKDCTTPANGSDGKPEGISTLYKFTDLDGNTENYYLDIRELSPASPTFYVATLYRQVNAGTPDRILTGYCKKNDTSIVDATYTDPYYSLRLLLYTGLNGEQRDLTIDGARRTYSPS